MSLCKKDLDASPATQRNRNDKHRENFETLKAQYISLHENHQSLQRRYAAFSEEYDQLHTKSQEIITTLQQERDKKIVECEELTAQILTKQKLKLLKDQWTREIQEQFKKKIDSAENNLEGIRGEYNKLAHSYTFLKSEYECSLSTHESVLQEMKVKHELEVSSYAEQLKLVQTQADVSSHMQQIRQLQRLNSELQQRVSSLENELEDLQKEKEKAYTQVDQCLKQQLGQSSNVHRQVQHLEAERSSLQKQLESLQTDLSSSQKRQVELQNLADQAQKKCSHLFRYMEETEATHLMEISEVKMEGVCECQKMEEACERAVADQAALHTQLQLVQKTLIDYKTRLASKDRDLEKQIQAVKEEEWVKATILQKENIALEEKLTELQKAQTLKDEVSKHSCATLEEKIQALHMQKLTMESEMKLLQAEVQANSKKQLMLESDLSKALCYKIKHQNLLAQYQSIQQRGKNLLDGHRELQTTICLLEEKVSQAQEELVCLANTHQKALKKERHLWHEEKSRLLHKLEGKNTEANHLTQQLNEVKKSSKKRHYMKQIHELEKSLKLQKIKEDQLRTEKKTLQQSLELENMKLKTRLSEFKQEHDEFFLLLQSPPYAISTTGEHQKPLQRQEASNSQKINYIYNLEEQESAPFTAQLNTELHSGFPTDALCAPVDKSP